MKIISILVGFYVSILFADHYEINKYIYIYRFMCIYIYIYLHIYMI